MKKILLGTAAAFLCFSLNAQVLDKAQVKNTLWTGFGNPFDRNTTYYGFTDVFQVRQDVKNFTLEGMLSMGALANYENEGDVDNFQIGTTNLNPLALHYGKNSRYSENTNGYYVNGIWYNNAVNSSSTLIDAFYVNFIWHLNRNFDFAMGTKINWEVGPAPRYGDWLWGADAHVRQGGFSTAYDDRGGAVAKTSDDVNGTYRFTPDRPGTADVVGFVHFANTYAKRALAARFVTSSKDFGLELGAAIPNGFNTDDPAINLGAKIVPLSWLSIGAAMEGAFDDGANFYSGVTIGDKDFSLDVYLAVDSLFTSVDDDQSYGTGATITFVIPKTKITLQPEIGVNFFENSDYSLAWYTGANLILPIGSGFQFSVYGSLAFGSKDKRWDDYKATDDWDGGHVFTARPALKYEFNKNATFDVYVNLENRESFDGKTRNAWSSGVFFTYIF